jgi:hypothetical protein
LPERIEYAGFATVFVNYNTGPGFEDGTEVPERRGRRGLG